MADPVVALVPAPDELTVEYLAAEPERLIVVAGARRSGAPCPVCGCMSARVQSRYDRDLADLPWHGLAVALRVRVRRFVCAVPRCPRRIFCERLPGTAAAHARRTTRLASALEVIGLALGGEAGARLARALGMAAGASADTLLRVLRAEPVMAPAEPPVRVLGVDDWAWRKGRTYGTVLVDLERRRVLDLLPDREPATLAAWLRAHPSVEVISRDRAGAYAEGARLGAPGAVQVADRFHLFRNLTDAVLRHVERHRHLLRGLAAPDAERLPAPPPAPAPPCTRDARAKAAVRTRRLARYERVVALHAKGWSGVAIAREVGLVRQTVMRWLHRGGYPERRVGPPRARPIAHYAEYLARRWAEGCHNARRLERELRGLGYRGGRAAVGDWIRTHLGRRAAAPALGDVPRPRRWLTARRAAWLLTAPDARLSPTDLAWRAHALAAVPELGALHATAQRFRELFDVHDTVGLDRWLQDAAHGPLAWFARGLRRDVAAVRAAITEPWSQGQVEGHVHRLKLVKRTMYGRAGFALLRRRVLAA
jgi:transposase